MSIVLSAVWALTDAVNTEGGSESECDGWLRRQKIRHGFQQAPGLCLTGSCLEGYHGRHQHGQRHGSACGDGISRPFWHHGHQLRLPP
jgi:hypothetical protein